MSAYSLGLDLGTTNIKACAVSQDGKVLLQMAQPSFVIPVESGAEMDPHRFLSDLFRFLQKVLEQMRKYTDEELCCISITGMAEAGCLINSTKEPVNNVLLWYDRRGEAEADELRGLYEDEILPVSGIRLSNVPSVYKLAYLKKHIPIAGLRWCGVPELAAMYLSGEWFTDPTLAVRTGCFDGRSNVYSDEILSLVGVNMVSFPPACNALEQDVRISAEMAKALGVSKDVGVVVAGHDDIAASYGAGLSIGGMVDSAGTAEALTSIVTDVPPLEAVARSHMAAAPYYLPGTWVILGGAGTTGNLLAQLSKRYALSYAELDRLAAEKKAYPDGAVEAEVTARKFTDITFADGLSTAQAANAVYDLLLKAFMAKADSMMKFCGKPVQLTVNGGGASAAELCARKAHALGDLPYRRMCDIEAAAYGAAVLGIKNRLK